MNKSKRSDPHIIVHATPDLWLYSESWDKWGLALKYLGSKKGANVWINDFRLARMGHWTFELGFELVDKMGNFPDLIQMGEKYTIIGYLQLSGNPSIDRNLN